MAGQSERRRRRAVVLGRLPKCGPGGGEQEAQGAGVTCYEGHFYPGEGIWKQLTGHVLVQRRLNYRFNHVWVRVKSRKYPRGERWVWGRRIAKRAVMAEFLLRRAREQWTACWAAAHGPGQASIKWERGSSERPTVNASSCPQFLEKADWEIKKKTDSEP